MKNRFLILLFVVFFSNKSFADNILIQSKKITLDKNKEVSIFEEEVLVQTEENSKITSDYAEYDKKNNRIKFKNNIIVTDVKNNIIETNFAEYNENTKIFKSTGPTKITTTENYIILGEDIIFNNDANIINSNKKTLIIDQDENTINLENFEYLINDNIFKSIGFIEIKDKNENSTQLSQIYVDTNKKEILGTDIKSFINQDNFKINEKNKPRVFSNSVKIEKDKSSFNQSVFTICDYRKNDKCPPWSLQSNKMTHDKTKKQFFIITLL